MTAQTMTNRCTRRCYIRVFISESLRFEDRQRVIVPYRVWSAVEWLYLIALCWLTPAKIQTCHRNKHTPNGLLSQPPPSATDGRPAYLLFGAVYMRGRQSKSKLLLGVFIPQCTTRCQLIQVEYNGAKMYYLREHHL